MPRSTRRDRRFWPWSTRRAGGGWRHKGTGSQQVTSVVFGAGLSLIYSAPAVLSEAAFEFLLAGRLIKRSKKMDDPSWMRSVVRATWVPFAAVLAISVATGWMMHAYFPELGRIADLFRR